MTPNLTAADEIVARCASQDATPDECLAELRAHGLTADREALSEAVAATHLRDTFILRQGDPYSFVGIAPRAGLRVWDLAVELAEDALESQIRFLAMKP